jgi:L-threonate 2-dehydrogenase
MSDSNSKAITVAIIGAGEMGAAVGRRLREMGARVITPLRSRSAESVERVRQAGLEAVDDDDTIVREAQFILSIVPPGVAMAVAESLREPLKRAAVKPVFAECNAVSPTTARRIAAVLADTGCHFVDAGIIGGPPPMDRTRLGPRFYASGPDAHLLARLNDYGLDIAVLDGPVGAASGLKMSYAGLTKGMTALAAAMIGAASREGLGAALRNELARTQPDFLTRFERQLPGMYPKAYRWVAEMEEIADHAGAEDTGAPIYRGMARLYERIAADWEGGRGLPLTLDAFLKGEK